MAINSLAQIVLLFGAFCSNIAAMAHLACILKGPTAYRFMGAGERMARAAEAGRIQPTLLTLAIAAVLFLWSTYALSGAGVIKPFPFTKPALVLISTVYLARALAFPLLKPIFPENSTTFWLVSSTICAIIGLAYAYGTYALWHTL